MQRCWLRGLQLHLMPFPPVPYCLPEGGGEDYLFEHFQCFSTSQRAGVAEASSEKPVVILAARQQDQEGSDSVVSWVTFA